MPKNIIVYSDGTGQDGGVRPEQRVSNIYKMYRASRVAFDNAIDPAVQVAMYDAGLGTDIGATAMTAPGRFIQKLLASVDGRGILTNIIDCYTFILDHYQPGDRIFLFGFSRGAYTVRSVADLLRLCGVPTKTPSGELPRFRRATRLIAEEAVLTVLEHGAGHPRAKYEAERDELAQRFRTKYGSDHEGGEVQRSNAAPYFIGVFDTVAALGAQGPRRAIIQAGLFNIAALAGLVGALLPAWLLANAARALFSPEWWWPVFLVIEFLALAGAVIALRVRQRRQVKKTVRDFPKPGDVKSHYAQWEGKNFNRLLSRFVTYARSANAIDETRADFDRVPWGPTAKGVEETAGIPTFRQFFFAGNHSDVGGSYAEVESRLSDIALAWMLEEAIRVPNGLRVGPVFIHGQKLQGSGDQGLGLYLYPAEGGAQHSEIAGMHDTLDALPRFIARFFRNNNYAQAIRKLPPDATVHPTVELRFALSAVQHADGVKPYRPEALRNVDAFKHGYGVFDSLHGEN